MNADNYQLQAEGERSQKAVEALQIKTIVSELAFFLDSNDRSQEFSRLRMQHDNIEMTLRTATEKVKNGEREILKLQYG